MWSCCDPRMRGVPVVCQVVFGLLFRFRVWGLFWCLCWHHLFVIGGFVCLGGAAKVTLRWMATGEVLAFHEPEFRERPRRARRLSWSPLVSFLHFVTPWKSSSSWPLRRPQASDKSWIVWKMTPGNVKSQAYTYVIYI